MISPTRFGKTSWARSLAPHLYFNNYTNFKEAKESISEKLWIFDDFSSIPSFYKGVFGGQREFNVTDKYCQKMTIIGPKSFIWLCNEFDRIHLDDEKNYIIANSIIVELQSPLF